LCHLTLHDLTAAAKEREGPANWEPEGVDTASRVEVAPDGVVVDPKTRLGEVARVVRYWRSNLHHRRGARRRGGGDCRGCRWTWSCRGRANRACKSAIGDRRAVVVVDDGEVDPLWAGEVHGPAQRVAAEIGWH